MCNLGNCFKIWNVIPRVANALNVHGLGLFVNGSLDIFCAIPVDELGCYTEASKENLELVVGASVQVGS